MRKIYHLGTCDTNRRIIKELDLKNQNLVFQDIKKENITDEQLDEMKFLSGSYSALFSKRSRSFSKLGLKDKTLSEQDLKDLILSDYTFLQRPVVILNDKIFVGNSRSNIDSLNNSL